MQALDINQFVVKMEGEPTEIHSRTIASTYPSVQTALVNHCFVAACNWSCGLFHSNPFFDTSFHQLLVFSLESRIIGCGLTLLQYQKSEHLPQRFKETAFLLHPWQVLIPSTFSENCRAWSPNSSNFSSDIGKILRTKSVI